MATLKANKKAGILQRTGKFYFSVFELKTSRLVLTYKLETMAQYNPFVFSSDFTPLDHDQYIQSVIADIEMEGMSQEMQHMVQQMLYQSAHATGNPIVQFTRHWLQELTNHVNGTFTQMVQEMQNLSDLVSATMDRQDRQDDEIRQLRNQLNALSGSGGGATGSKNPKVAQPPNFRGSDDKLTLEEWKNLVSLWNKSQQVANDTQKIVNALSLLQGPAQKLMKSYYDKNAKDEDLGKMEDFWATLEHVYGHRNAVEGARKDLEALFKNTDLAKKDFIKYAERFQVLAEACAGEFMDKHLIEKL